MNLAEGESEGIACAKLLFFPVGRAGASGHTHTHTQKKSVWKFLVLVLSCLEGVH